MALAVAIALILLVAFATWRARDAYGASQRLPPGSLSLRSSFDALTDPRFYARAAAHHGPVFKMSQFHRPVVCIADLSLGLDVLERQGEKLRAPTQPFWRRSPVQLVAFLGDERHVRHRPILGTVLTREVIGRSRDGVAAIIDAELRRAHIASSGGVIDPRPLLDRVAFASVCHVLFGYGPDDRRLDPMRALITSRRFDDHGDVLAQAVAEIRASGVGILAGFPQDQRSVLGEILRIAPHHLDDGTLLGNLALIARVTLSNVRGVLEWTLKELLGHPQVLGNLQVASTNADDLAAQVVQETMRLHQSEFIYREATGDVHVGGYRIPPGWLIRVCVREAHDDPAIFPEPGEFRPERFAGRTYGRTEYCPFSDGTHSTVGAELTTMIAQTFVTVFARQWSGRTTNDGPIVRDANRHWSHWRPSKQWRVTLTPRREMLD